MILEKSAIMGYCNGVAHVINLAHECIRLAKEADLPAYSIGWFIHNPTVVEHFSRAGMRHIEFPEEGTPGIALIRAHGIGDPLRDRFERAGYQLIDGTCGNVAYSQRMIRNSDPSYHVVLAGLADHSEVKALSHVWNAQKEIIPVSIVEHERMVDELPSFGEDTVLLMAQTTFPSVTYENIIQRMQQRFGDRLKM